MSKLWLKRILQVAGALALVALAVIVYRRTDWCKGFTPDGVMTLIAGVIAFIAVIIQIRSSSKQVQDQIKAQRDAEREERERHKRAIATAILYEIDSFYRIDLELADKTLAGWDAASNNLPSAAGLRTNISEIYKGISPLLGSLNASSVSAIVKFYSMVGTYEGLWHSYQFSLDMLRAPANAAVRLSPQSLMNDAKTQLKGIRDLIPQLKELAATVTSSVAHDCGLDELIGRGNAQTH
jgi:hypothetical protein